MEGVTLQPDTEIPLKGGLENEIHSDLEEHVCEPLTIPPENANDKHKMAPRIKSASLPVKGSKQAVALEFGSGLNILSGVNGTGKTQVLAGLKQGQYIADGDSQPRVAAFSPQRNSERRTIEQIVQAVRSQGKGSQAYAAEGAAATLQDNTFER